MSELYVNSPLFMQPFDATGLDGKPVTVYFIGRVMDRVHTWAMSVPPQGAGRWMCTSHMQLFKVGGQCPVCAGTTTQNGGVSQVVTASASAEIAEQVN